MHMTRFILRYFIAVSEIKFAASSRSVYTQNMWVIYIHTGTCLCTEGGPSVLCKLEFNLRYRVATKKIKLAKPTFLTFNLYKFFFLEMPWLILQTKIWKFRIIQMGKDEKFPLGVPRWPSLVVEDQHYHCCGSGLIPDMGSSARLEYSQKRKKKVPVFW